MSRIIFIGDKTKGYFIEDVARSKDMDYGYVDVNGHIRYQTNQILDQPDTKFMVFDIEQYIDDSETVAIEITRIMKCNNAKTIIYASGYAPTSKIILNLWEHGIKEYIFSSYLGDMKDELGKCMNGFYETNGIEALEKVKVISEAEEETKESYNFKMIGVAGASVRIGTTTQAIHIVKYLMYKGYKACYIHMNNTDFIEQTQEWFECECDEDLGRITVEGVDHFYRVEKISDVKKLGYDYYVYDYGAYFDPNFNKVSFLEKDIKVFVLGYKPQEIGNSYKLVRNLFYDDVKYIFSFGSHFEDDDMEELMQEKGKDTIVPQDCSDMYVFTEPDLYQKIIPVESIMEEEGEEAKKRSIFPFGRRKRQ